MNSDKTRYEKLYNMITQSKYCVALTGAGISTLSGIKDFRGKDGLYTQPNTDKMFDIDIFHQTPSLYYSLAKDFIYGLKEKQPSVVHKVLAALEQKGMLKALITQNIDLLHQKAGSQQVIEIHGSPECHHCTHCSYSTDFDSVAEIAHTGEVPRCPQCGHALKPDITFFGEALPQEALTQAHSECQKADLLLILGTSLSVYPAAALPQITAHAGGQLIIVNEQPTYCDDYAAIRCTDLEAAFDYLQLKLSH